MKTSDQIHQEWRLLSSYLYNFTHRDFPAHFTTEQMIDQIWHRHQNLELQPNVSPITRKQIEALSIGDYISNCGCSRYGVPVDGWRWNTPKPILEIFAKDVDVKGKMFACFCLKLSETSQISGSVKEGEQSVIILSKYPT